MSNKIYGISRYGNYEIVEFDILKETPKQYIVRCNSDYWHSEYTLNKRDLSNFSYLAFVLGYTNAITKRKEIIQQRIQEHKKTIQKSESIIIELNKILSEIEDVKD